MQAEDVLFILGDALDECLVLPLSKYQNLQIETVHADCTKGDANAELVNQLDEIFQRRGRNFRKIVAFYHLTMGGDRHLYNEAQLKVADVMDIEFCKTFESYGCEVTPIDAKHGECSLDLLH
jgi:hypothetical protein